MVLVIYSLA